MYSFFVLLALLQTTFAADRCQWAVDFLGHMGFPNSANNQMALLGWMQGEGSPCRNNPLDTTENCCGGSNCNGAGVKNYPSWAAGLDASAQTLRLSYYNNIRAHFAASSDPITTATAIASSPWGTHDAVSATRYCMANRAACCNHGVA